MSKKPWRNKSGSETMPQKYSWKKIKIYNSYDEADKRRNELKDSGSLTKIRRCGPGGTKFKVLTGQKLGKESKKE